MRTKLKIDHELFTNLESDPPLWWMNLVKDRELYVDVRKNNYLNIYHNGGSLMKLEWGREYKATIHFEYIPLQKIQKGYYVPFDFQNNNVSFGEIQPIALNNFEQDALTKIKKRMRKFYGNASEKGLQAKYVIVNNHKKTANGFFIDTEFEYDNNRIDMVWVDIKKKNIAFVELKTIEDARLYLDEDPSQDVETIKQQLMKYSTLVCQHAHDLIRYYDKVFQIKKNLHLLPAFSTKEKSLLEYTFIEKPILLIGNCTQEWIEKRTEELEKKLKGIAFGCVYQGKNTFNFNIPYKENETLYSRSLDER